MKRFWKHNWILITAIVVHAIWGFTLLFSDVPLHTTPLGLLHSVDHLNNRFVAAVLYLGTALLAFIPIAYKRLDTKFVGLMFSIPQQFLLMISFGTAVCCVWTGRYPDGYSPDLYGDPRLFIFVDQLWPVVGMVAHTLSLVDWYWWSRNP
jgi:hypothetical protein